MKKSTLVTLVLSGALVTGCDDGRQNGKSGYNGDQAVTNNTHVSGLGYYHAPYHGWFEYPYNYYRPGFGYYHGGLYSPQPYVSEIVSSYPSGGGFTSRGWGGNSGESSSGVSRGGFGSSGHGGEGGS